MVISASLQACGVVFPFAMPTSICRSIVTICSGLYLLIGMTSYSSKWILSHSTWYKFCRSRQLVRMVLDQLTKTFDRLSIKLRFLHLVLHVHSTKWAESESVHYCSMKGPRFRNPRDEGAWHFQDLDESRSARILLAKISV